MVLNFQGDGNSLVFSNLELIYDLDDCFSGSSKAASSVLDEFYHDINQLYKFQ